jgi:hypothetical protein
MRLKGMSSPAAWVMPAWRRSVSFSKMESLVEVEPGLIASIRYILFFFLPASGLFLRFILMFYVLQS